MRTSEVLNKAANLIEERGWGQGPDTWEGYGGLCLEGGIGAALGRVVNGQERDTTMGTREVNACPAGMAVRAYLDDRLPFFPSGRPQPLYHWNDREDRTAAEVIEVLRAAAVIEQAKEQQDAPQAVSA